MKKIGKTSKINKTVKTILAFIVVSILAVAFNIAVNMSQAFTMYVWSGVMPSSGVASVTGYFPQSYSGGIVLCNDNQTVVRWGSKDYTWRYLDKSEYSANAYESANDSALVEKLKNKIEYKIKVTRNWDNSQHLDHWYSSLSSRYDSGENGMYYKAREYPSSVSVAWEGDMAKYGNDSKPLVAIVTETDYPTFNEWSSLQHANVDVENATKTKLSLSGEVKPSRLQEGYDSENKEYLEDIISSSWNGNALFLGPQVAVSGTGDTSAYSKKDGASIDTRSTSDFASIMTAYIYTGEYHYGRQNTTPYNLSDVQVANWLQNDHNQNGGGGAHGYNADGSGTSTITQGISSTRGQELYSEARQYYQFITSLKANGNVYQATVNTGDSQVFVSRDDGNRNNDEYVIGPVSITYPYYHNISYMTDIIVDATNKDGGSATLSYKNGDFKIVMQSQGGTALTGGTIFPGENGITNENFYIIINASKAAYPDEISIRGAFEYTDYCKTTYETWYPTGGIQVYRYVGIIVKGTITYTTTYYWCFWTEKSESYEYTVDGDSYWEMQAPDGSTHKVYDSGTKADREAGGWRVTGSGRDKETKTGTRTVREFHNETDTKTAYAAVLQGIILMDVNNEYQTKVEDFAQEVRKITYVTTSSSTNAGSTIVVVVDEPEPSSSQTTYAHKASAKAEAKLDLTIKIGGKVWVDGTAGKESNYDGQFNENTDTPMSNVTVKLHQRKPDGSESVKAETKTDGNGNYSFENLNALYTYYVEFVYNGQYYQPTKYKVGEWANSSKGTDNNTERDNFNARFEEIKSYPQNYSGGAVYTRDDLKSAGLIDDFGNPTGSNQFVNDCMMSSYTGYNNGGYTFDYYPVYQKFVIGQEINGANKASITRDTSGQAISSYNMLYAGSYNNLNVNQGYVLRETADLAARKDVLHTTLEMNGKEPQVYKYNKNDESGAADISVRISDYYYGTNYTREIYKEDYYKPLETGTATTLAEDDWLKIYVTYKIRLTNQSGVLAAAVTEVVDYYDDEYTLIGSDNTVTSEQKYKPYIGDRKGNKIEGATGVSTNEHSKYGTATESDIAGYKKTYIRTDSEVKIPESGGDLYIYVTFKVNSLNNLLILDDGHGSTDNGKANIIEINGYRTYYTDKSHSPNEGTSNQEYSSGDIAGIVDVDSIPGNLKTDKINKNTTFTDKTTEQLRSEYGLEDDSDKAPSIKIKLYNDEEHNRKASGTVWDDSRDTDSDLARVGNGKLDSGESGVQNVQVELIDMKASAKNSYDVPAYVLVTDASNYTGNKISVTDPNTGESYIWAEAITKTDSNGNYSFSGYIPSNYVVKFIYGTDAMKDGNGTIKYNGQDYKSTSYYTPTSEDKEIYKVSYNVADPDNNSYTYTGTVNSPETAKTYNLYGAASNNPSTTYFYNLTKSNTDKVNNADRYSDARDIMGTSTQEGTRTYVNTYSNNSGNGVTNALAQELNSTTSKTYMVAQSGQISVELEYDRTETSTSSTGSDNAGSSNTDKSGYYRIENLDFGLVERPKAQIKVTKQVANVKVTLANGNTLFDATSKATNVQWLGHTAHNTDTANTYKTNDNYKNKMMIEPSARSSAANKGSIQLTMDEELMHGSTLQITYIITAANIGEVDYLDNQFYYTGVTSNKGIENISRTSPDLLIDYVGTQTDNDKSATRNNLQFSKEQNTQWTVVEKEQLNTLLSESARGTENANTNAYTTIITTDALKKNLVPIIADQDNAINATSVTAALESDPLNALDTTVNKTNSVVGTKLVLTQTLTQDSDSDDMRYNNLVELVTSSNTVGRRMAYSVAGNQNPTEEPKEIDADDAQDINILPPFGQTYIYYILGIAIAAILIAGITTIIVVFRKRNK